MFLLEKRAVEVCLGERLFYSGSFFKVVEKGAFNLFNVIVMYFVLGEKERIQLPAVLTGSMMIVIPNDV